MSASSIIVYDQYQQPWRLEEGDPLYAEALASQESPLVWPLKKITEGRGWGWWSVFKGLDEFEADLERIVPSPGKQRLIELDREYSPTELQDLLQRFGSYLATLNHIVAMIEAQAHALKEGLKTGLAVAVAGGDPKASLASKEADVLAGNETFKQTRRLQIKNEATLILAKGWLDAYTAAYNTVSRMVTLVVGEASLQTGRHP